MAATEGLLRAMGAPSCTEKKDYLAASRVLLDEMLAQGRKGPGAAATAGSRGAETSGASLKLPGDSETVPTSSNVSNLPGCAVSVLQGADSQLHKVDDAIMPPSFASFDCGRV